MDWPSNTTLPSFFAIACLIPHSGSILHLLGTLMPQHVYTCSFCLQCFPPRYPHVSFSSRSLLKHFQWSLPWLFSCRPSLFNIFFFLNIIPLTVYVLLILYMFSLTEDKFHEARKFCLFCLFLFIQCLEQYLAHNRHSVSVCWLAY